MKALMTVLSSLDPISFYSQCNLFWSLPGRQFRVTFFLFVYAVISFCKALREPAKVRLCMLSRAACPCSLALRTARNPDVSRAFGALPEHCFVPGIYYYAQTMLKNMTSLQSLSWRGFGAISLSVLDVFCRFRAASREPAGVLWPSVLFFCFWGAVAVQGYQTSGLVLSAGEDKGGGGGVLRPGFSGRVLIRPGARCLEEKGRPERLSVFDWYSLLFML